MTVVVTLIAIGSARSAYATPPDVQVIEIDSAFRAGQLTRACGFDVQRHEQGTLTLRSFYDQNGSLKRELSHYDVETTFTANGKSLRSVGRHETANTTYNEDGSMTLLLAGPTYLTTLPGEGVVWGGTGSVEIWISPDGEEVTIRESGPIFLEADEVCSALAP